MLASAHKILRIARLNTGTVLKTKNADQHAMIETSQPLP